MGYPFLFLLSEELISLQYSFSSIKKMEPLIDSRIDDWLAKLSEVFVKTGQCFDSAPWAV